MKEQLKEKLDGLAVSIDKYSSADNRWEEYFGILSEESKNQVLALVKEAGYVRAVLIGDRISFVDFARLLDNGWLPPEEAKKMVKLADDQSLPECLDGYRPTGESATTNLILKKASWRKVILEVKQ